MAELSPAQRVRSDTYFEGGYWLILWDLLIALGVAWLLLGTRLSARMRSFAPDLRGAVWPSAPRKGEMVRSTDCRLRPRDL
jgi:STE24 endopeptidase